MENAIRSPVMNRRNALFAGHDKGGRNWARFASLIATCKMKGVEPDLPPSRPSFITRVWFVDSRRFRVGQARRVRCCQVVQVPGVLLPGFCFAARNAA